MRMILQLEDVILVVWRYRVVDGGDFPGDEAYENKYIEQDGEGTADLSPPNEFETVVCC